MKFHLPFIKGKEKSKQAGGEKSHYRITSLDRKKAKSGWLFVLPFIIGFVLIYIPIVWQSILYSFGKLNYLSNGGVIRENVMFDNYITALTNQGFRDALGDGMKQLALQTLAILFFSLFIAIILNQKMVGRAAFRAIFFIPVILATGLISGIDASTNNAATAANQIATGSAATAIISADDIKGLFSNMIVGKELVEYVTGFVNDIFDIVNRSGVQILIFLAGLQSISPSVYESCEMEGASAWESFWKITLPMISPMILVNFVYTLIDSFTAESNGVMKFISSVYNNPAAGGMVVASAMSWLYFALIILIVAALGGIISSFVFYQRRD